MWYDESVIYQVYPFGFCDAPRQIVLTHEETAAVSRIGKMKEWIPHLEKLGINALYFCPLWESDSHGYDTRDYTRLDRRLGTNEDLKELIAALHKAGIRVILDAVFNHVGRGCPFFLDVIKNRENSKYKDWFFINFQGNSNYDDDFRYEGWEGHYDLVKLNLRNPDVKAYLFDCVKLWMDDFHINGLRLDVAYMVDRDFMQELRTFCLAKDESFFLIGEMIHGDYNQIVNDRLLHSATNYECYKGLFSSFNSMNLFEIGHSLKRQFGSEQWTLYRGKNLLCFVDNHDVSRIASVLTKTEHLPCIYGLLCTMPGIPCIYYGSEWGVKGRKEDGDWSLRPAFVNPEFNDLTLFISQCVIARKSSKALSYGSFEIILMTNHQIIFERKFDDERVIVTINADAAEYTAHFNANAGRAKDLITGEVFDFGGGSKLEPYSVKVLEIF